MKKTPVLITASIVLFLLVLIIYQNYQLVVSRGTQNNASSTALQSSVEDRLISGERDENGCLASAGYVFDEEIGACVRSWELDATQREIAKAAVEGTGGRENLTIMEVTPDVTCESCYNVKYEVQQTFFNVLIQDGKAVKLFEVRKNTELNGISFTTYQELVYKLAIEAFEIDAESLVLLDIPVRWSIPEGRVMEYEGKGVVYEGDYRSQDVANRHTALLRKLGELGFKTDSYNEIPAVSDATVSRMRNGDYICNVMLTGDFEGGTSRAQLSCMDVAQN